MEGLLVENGFVSLQTDGVTGTHASCQLEMVPTDTIRHIMAGTWVHVFVTDPWEVNPAQDLSDFKLLFEGVVVGRGFTRLDDARSFVIQCASPEIYWTQAKQFWLNMTSSNGDIVEQLMIATTGGYGRFGKVTKTGTFGYLMNRLAYSRETEEQAEDKFLDTLVSVLDDIGNVNPYYTNARNRMRLTDRIIRAPAGHTEKLFKLALISDFLDGISGRSSGQTNLVIVINQLLSAIIHEWVPMLAPPYIKSTIFDRDVFGNVKKTKQTVKRKSKRGERKVDLYDYKVAEDHIVASVMFKPHVYTIDPPNFNVLFPNMYDQMSYHEDFLGEPTRLSMKPQLPLVSAKYTQGLLLQRPVELEVFSALIQDSSTKAATKRTADGEYGDGAGQAPTFTDYDWATNEERIRGISYNFINLAPSASALTLSDQGEKTTGGRKGGIPDFLQNVASYEYYKAKFMARQTSVSGPFNMRVVPGFPMVLLDDSQSNLNVIGYLAGVHHQIMANGSATTSYELKYPRIAGEVDLNRPKFRKGYDPEGNLDVSLAIDPSGNFQHEELFDGANQPPVPEWFDDSFRNTRELDLQYQEWFGENAGVIQGFLFRSEDNGPLLDAIQQAANVGIVPETILGNLDLISNQGLEASGRFRNALEESKDEFAEVQRQNENIPIEDAINELNRRYRVARGQGGEFDEAASFTARRMTKIDEAFRFVGAAPMELRDDVSSDSSSKDRAITFGKNPASARVIDYKKMRLDAFAGDVSPGSGYSGVGLSSSTESTDEEGDVETSTITDDAANRMSGAFPLFDTKIHSGEAATKSSVRKKVAKAESQPSDRARYDGRPLMYDFEYRLWQDSLANAGITPSQEEIADGATQADYVVQNDKGGHVRHKTPKERLQATQDRQAKEAAESERLKAREARGRSNPKSTKATSMPPDQQAPTGDGLSQEDRVPLTQPLSEKQSIDLRRGIVRAYRDELKRNRGFTG